MMMWEDFLIRAAIAGFGVALAAGPLGSFVVWRKMAYFGDTLAHAALLGAVAGLYLKIGTTLGTLMVCIGAAIALSLLQRRRLAADTVLGIISHGSLSLGLVALALMPRVRIDLMAYLFGDILSVTWNDVLWIWGGGLVALVIMAALWRPLLMCALDEDLAQAEGIPVAKVRLVITILMALVVALSMQVVGVLLITSLLIIPAAAARRLTSSPEGMVVGASLGGILSVSGGLMASVWWDTPSGPSIVVASLCLFAVSGLLSAGRRK